jgi:hypothetical protein
MAEMEQNKTKKWSNIGGKYGFFAENRKFFYKKIKNF